jgi:serine/threonine protein kinase
LLECLDGLEQLATNSEMVAIDETATLFFVPTVSLPGNAQDVSDQSPRPGFSLGNYELLEEMGRGGMGVVFKARETKTGRIVALKMILGNHLASREHLQRFQTEIRLMAKLEHNHIVHLYETGEWNGLLYFSMQCVEGSNLARKCQEGPINSTDAAHVVAKIARAVAYLHSRGIVHRDLKPGNILLDTQGQVYVTDFGLAKILEGGDAQTKSGVIIGTPSYMSPEQACGRTKNIGPASDIYSLGSILYETLTGQPPFRGESQLETILRVLEGEPTPPRQIDKTIPVDLEWICLRCLETHPEQRYPSADALAEDLDRFLRGEEIDRHQMDFLPRIRRWARREPALASRLGTLAVCLPIIQIDYLLSSHISLFTHVRTLGILAFWAIGSFLLQCLLNRKTYPAIMQVVWSATDVAVLTFLIWCNHDFSNPIVIGYPILVAGSGLWVQIRMVWYTALFSVLGYATLAADALLQNQIKQPIHHHVIFVFVLLVLGYIVAYQVQRIRTLSRYLEQRR